MSDIPPTLRSGDDDLARSDTPLASKSPSQVTTRDDTAKPMIVMQPPGCEPSPSPASNNPPSSSIMLPIPTLLTNDSQTPLVLSDVMGDTPGVDTVPAELANADITLAPDGSFVETPSGPAARELKRYWDQQIGVGKSVRSPYAITAFVNQHGKQMFRVGHRELSAPAANAAEIEERVTQSSSTPSEPSNSPRVKRRSRMSVHAFPSMFGSISSGTRSQFSQASVPRKLRKTRSIPDMVSSANDTYSSQNGGTSAGRIHSRSVTGADVSPFSTVVRNPNNGDLFGEVMDWQQPPDTPESLSTYSLTQASDESHDQFNSSSIIAYPFGHGVMYDSPSRKTSPAEPLLPPQLPRLLREVQSFESGLTARQVDLPKRPGKESSLGMESYFEDPDSGRPPSALRVHPHPSSPDPYNDLTPTSPTPEPIPSPAPESVSRYSIDVFDVLQTYRGLPLLDKLSFESEETTVIKLSLSADESAAPRDDPRFVIWGEVQLDRDRDDQSLSHESSVTDLSVHSSSLSKRRASKAKTVEMPSARPSAGEMQKVLIAATIERWIAQLTSDLNYDELLNFFLTYRTYVGAVDLCHLLIARFHWALQPSTSSHDERVRRIVRVRTFVAIRYWLLTFFTVDFLPNRELRLLVANWLNTLIRDPMLKKHSDSLGIVRKLIKVTKECKQAHTRSGPTKPSKPRSSLGAKSTPAKKDHVLGEKFAAATRKTSVEDEDSDVDLDFVPDEESSQDNTQGYPQDIANAHLSAAHVGAGLSPARPSSIPFSSFSILQRTDHAPGPGPGVDLSFVQNPAALPIHHSALSRVFVKTIGRLGRWRRVLNSRSAARASIGACTDMSSAFDLEISGSRDLLTVNGGVERYLNLKAARPALAVVGVPTPESVSQAPENKGAHAEVAPVLVLQEPNVTEPPIESPADLVQPGAQLPPGLPVPDESPEHETTPEPLATLAPPKVTHQDDPALSIRSSTSTDSFGEPLTSAHTFPPLAQSQWQFDGDHRFDVVSIDDLDLSDTSSEHHEGGPSVPPGLRRPPRKLPLRRDFEFVQRPETVSSMGLTSRDSLASNASSHASGAEAVGLGGNVAQWQLNALIDSLSDDEETGDREAALRKLEGQINPQKQQEKASKVDGWVRTIQERMAAGDYEDEPPNFSDDSDEEEFERREYEDQWSDNFDHDSASVHQLQPAPSISQPDVDASAEGTQEMVHTPIPTQTTHIIVAPPNPGSPTRSSDAKPVLEDAVPIEILQSRVPSRPSTSSGASNRLSLSRFAANPEAPRAHRSFILNHRAASLAEHFSMIDRELFMGVKFEELVLDDWMNCKEVDVLDWAQYLKDRARWKVENRYPDKTSALGAVRARFNLMANFTISEIVLTPPHERPVLVSKFIRIAWKAYRMFDFSTLVAIITGLKSDWVTKAMKRPGWSRVGIWENRIFKDFKIFTTNTDDFKYIRQTVANIVDAKPLDASSNAASVVSGGGMDTQSGKGKAGVERPAGPTACIPFIGVYLSQLQRHSQLPDLIDPTAPNETVGVNSTTGNFDALAHPEVFSALAPLPPSMHLEPLINVHKQRRIASVIKALVAGQHLASRVQFDVDKKLFQRCLRLRGLNAETLQRVLSMYSE